MTFRRIGGCPSESFFVSGIYEEQATRVAPTAFRSRSAFGALVFSRPAAQAAVDVSGSDIENLVLPMARGFSIRGSVRVEDRELATINGFETIHVELASAGPGRHEQLPRPMSADGAFSLDNVFPEA
jgi:hypothetical protein